MSEIYSRMRVLHKPEDLGRVAKFGVSLHCHTEYSMEMLDFVPSYAEELPIVSFFWRRERDRYIEREGRGIDFSTAYWTPPLPAQTVFDIEKKQLEDAGLEPIVSLTDHDSIDANLDVGKNADNSRAPISLEWTVPYEYGFFHVGVHNLPVDRARELTDTLLEYSFSEDKEPNKERLHELFAMLDDIREVLVILNHPMWDIEMVGKPRHKVLLKGFIEEYGKWIHAFEINGFRSWSENRAVYELAETLGIPVTTGGDRHGCQPNTVINLTDADTFDAFAEEIRIQKKSEVVLMPAYKQPLRYRQLQSFSEILRLYPDFPVHRKRWFDRMFFDIGDEKGLASLSDHGWNRGGPLWLRWVIRTFSFAGSPTMRPVFSMLRKRKDRVPRTLDPTRFRTLGADEAKTMMPGSPTSAGSAG